MKRRKGAYERRAPPPDEPFTLIASTRLPHESHCDCAPGRCKATAKSCKDWTKRGKPR